MKRQPPPPAPKPEVDDLLKKLREIDTDSLSSARGGKAGDKCPAGKCIRCRV
jgi:hypothetical protein